MGGGWIEAGYTESELRLCLEIIGAIGQPVEDKRGQENVVAEVREA
jgi:hypothetical protein